MCIDTGYVILQNDVNREPCRLLQVALLQGVPCAKHLQKVGCYQTSSMAWQCTISALRDPRPYLMVNYASYAVFRAGCEVVVSVIRNRFPAMISTVAPSGKALKRRDAA